MKEVVLHKGQKYKCIEAFKSSFFSTQFKIGNVITVEKFDSDNIILVLVEDGIYKGKKPIIHLEELQTYFKIEEV